MSKDIGNLTELPQQLSLNSSKSNSKSGSVLVSSIILLGGGGDDQSRSLSCPPSNESKTSTKSKETNKLNTNTSKSKVDKNTAKNTNANGTKKILKKYFCSTCGQGFTRKHNMVSHELIHSSMKPHICTVCNSKFRRIHDLKRHEKLHTGEKPYICDRCFRSFARPDALTRHKNSQDACSAVKSETDAGVANTMGDPVFSDQSVSDSNTPMSTLDGSGGSNDRRSRGDTRSSTHTYRQPYTTTTTTTTTTTRRYEDSRGGNEKESQSLPPLESNRDRSQPTQLPPYSLILGNTQSDQNTSSWQLPLQQLPHQHHSQHQHPQHPQHPSPDHSPQQKQRNLPFEDGPMQSDMNYSRSIHHQPLILNNSDRQKQNMEPSQNQMNQMNQNINQNLNQNMNQNNQNLNFNSNQNLNFNLNFNLNQSLSQSLILNRNSHRNLTKLNLSLNLNLNLSLNLSLARTWPSSNFLGPLLHSHISSTHNAQDLDKIPGYPYLHEQSKNQAQQEEPKNYVTLAKYQDLVNYAQSLQDSMSKMNVRLKLLEGQRVLTNQLDEQVQADHHSD